MAEAEDAIQEHQEALNEVEKTVSGLQRRVSPGQPIIHRCTLVTHATVQVPIIDHFALVGIREPGQPGSAQPPQVLYHWSNDSTSVPTFQEEMVPQFCFPKGVPVASLRRTPSLSALDEVIFERSHIHHSTHTFVFRMTNEFGKASYGLGVMCEESIEQPPTFVQSTESAEPDLAVVHTAPVCYVIVTRFPVADLHFKILFSILAHEHLRRTTNRTQASVGSLGDGKQVLHDVLSTKQTTPLPTSLDIPIPKHPHALGNWSFFMTAGTRVAPGVKKLRSAERVHIFLDYDEVTAPEGCSSYLPKWSQLFTSLEPHYESLRALAQATSQPLSNSNIMLEAQPLLSKCLEVFKNFTECAAEVAFMMERTRSNPFGELQSDPKNIDPFYKSFLATQAWAVYRDETLMNARVPVHCLTPRARKEREEFDRQRELREANEQGA